MDMNRLRTNWIWLPNWIPEDDSDARIVYFRKEMMVDDALPAKKAIKITADSRYKLYINGKFVQEGPQKPLDQKEWFVDTANAAPYLVPGANVVAIEVLRFAASQNDSLYRTNTPVILVNRYIHSFETHTVCIDNYKGGYIAAMHLIEKGHRRIAHIASYKGTTPQMDRIQGFQEAMQCLPRGEYRYQVYFGDGTLERGNQVARELIKNGMPYTALFVADCQIAIGIVNTLREQGFRVPTDISILCFDDSPYINQYGLRLSTVTYNPLSMGATAVDLLAQLMSDRLSSISHVNLTPQLIQRDSVMDINKR